MIGFVFEYIVVLCDLVLESNVVFFVDCKVE